MKLGFIGLGKMGSRMVKKLLNDGHDLVVWNRSSEAIKYLEQEITTQNSKSKTITHKLKVSETIENLVEDLDKPRVVWMMLPAGEATENVLNEITKFIDPQDIIIDGGNSNWKDTERRYKKLKTKNIKFLGIGVSGGIIAAEKGYPMMVGGDKEAYEYVQPILETLAKPYGGYEYFGTGGAGHFVKMVHNGIEYGIMQSIGEGFEVLQKAEYDFNLVNVARLWQKGTLVSGFMLDRTVSALSKNPKLSNIEGVIAESGEARWTVETAKEEKVDVKIIEESLNFRRRSQKDKKIQKSFTAKMVAALRHEFGGHPIRQAQGKEVKKEQV